MCTAIKLNRFFGIISNKSPVKNAISGNFLSSLNTIRSFNSSTKLLYASVPFNLTDIGEGIREVAVKEWYVKVGDKVSQFDNICEVQSDKASVTITSRYDGVITKLYYDIDDVAYVGKPLVEIETNEVQVSEKAKDEVQIQESVGVENDKIESQETILNESINACIPSVRRLAREHNINLADVQGTGKAGRIMKEDILNYLEKGKTLEPIAQKVISKSTDRIEPVSGFRKAMIRTMTDALKIPHMVYCDEIAITQLSKIRKSLKKEAENKGIKLTLLPFFIKAFSNALHQYPILNSSLDTACENIIYKSNHNIGVAMDTKVGLAVPVIKNVEKLSILQIAKELNRLQQHTEDGRFTIDDLSGGTFTISNVGMIGGTYAHPVIISPQVAIVAIGTAKVLPRFDSNNIIIAEEIVNFSASADHRIIDGSAIANFINCVKKQLQNPYTLFLQ